MKRWSEYFWYREDSENNCFSRHIYFPSIPTLPSNEQLSTHSHNTQGLSIHDTSKAFGSSQVNSTTPSHFSLVLACPGKSFLTSTITSHGSSPLMLSTAIQCPWSFLFSYVHCQTYSSSISDPKREHVHCARRLTQSLLQASSNVNRSGKQTLKGKTEVQLHKKYLSLVSCYQS